ncbi:hypothetical protein BJ912DRAFT_986450, partial [Pholiota molesta]
MSRRFSPAVRYCTFATLILSAPSLRSENVLLSHLRIIPEPTGAIDRKNYPSFGCRARLLVLSLGKNNIVMRFMIMIS